MAMTYDDLYTAALGLPDEVRLALIENLIPTIRAEATVEIEQRNEVNRRVEEVRSGRVQTVPSDQVFGEVEASLRARRSAIVA